MNPRYLKALRVSVEQACRMPSRFAWDRKAAAHSEIFDLLADVAGDAAAAGSRSSAWSGMAVCRT
jgi:hypothetical protein